MGMIVMLLMKCPEKSTLTDLFLTNTPQCLLTSFGKMLIEVNLYVIVGVSIGKFRRLSLATPLSVILKRTSQ